MSKQILVGLLTDAEFNEAMAKGILSYNELYRLVGTISHREGVAMSSFVYNDVIDGLYNALLVSIDCGDADYDADWVYLPNVDWIYPDTDDYYLYERLFEENVEALFNCLECVECVVHVSKAAAEYLITHIGQPVFYNKNTQEYAWVLPYFGMPWSLVTVDVVTK